jgi:CheY-like chemotaxis protein
MLRLEFADKYRLWTELLRARMDRVFIATQQPPRLGSRVPVGIAVGSVQVTAEGMVLAVRGEGPRFKAGVWVRFDADEVEKVRRFLGLSEVGDVSVHGRRARRLECQLQVRFSRPPLPSSFFVENLSELGALVDGTLPLAPGQFVEGTITLDDATPFAFKAEVSRESDEGRLWGLRFLELGRDDSTRLHAQLERLMLTQPNAGACVMVADDEPQILEFLSRALGKFGYQVQKARSGDEALALIRELKPRLVLLDILMPGIDGVDICKTMRSDIELAHIPVIFLSAVENERLHAVADEAGATDYLGKPVMLTDLLNVVGQHLTGR